jgi:hypothetical protein
MTRELRPYSEMPVWARLQFMKVIPERYTSGDGYIPCKMSEVTVLGFHRMTRNMIYVYFTLDWICDDQVVITSYQEPLYKMFS